MFLRTKRYNTNIGWQFQDAIFTDYSDLSEKDYDIYLQQTNSDYYRYRKFKYNDTDEEFVKLYYTDNVTYNLNDDAQYYFYEYSFFNLDDFEYFEDTDEVGNIVPLWKIKSDVLSSTEFKSAFGNGLNQFGDNNSTRLDYVYLYVSNNTVSRLEYGYFTNIASNVDFTFHNNLYFDYTNYGFDQAGLSSGFTIYVQD